MPAFQSETGENEGIEKVESIVIVGNFSCSHAKIEKHKISGSKGNISSFPFNFTWDDNWERDSAYGGICHNQRYKQT